MCSQWERQRHSPLQFHTQQRHSPLQFHTQQRHSPLQLHTQQRHSPLQLHNQLVRHSLTKIVGFKITKYPATPARVWSN